MLPTGFEEPLHWSVNQPMGQVEICQLCGDPGRDVIGDGMLW